MTKLRTPLTFADAATQASSILGLPELARMTGRAERTIHEWQNPDSSAGPTIRQALAIDAACRASADASPWLDAFAFQLDVQVDRQDACRISLLGELATLARELGEVMAAAIAVGSNTVASPLDVHRAFAEATQAAAALDAVQRRLASFLPLGAGPGAGKAGGAL